MKHYCKYFRLVGYALILASCLVQPGLVALPTEPLAQQVTEASDEPNILLTETEITGPAALPTAGEAEIQVVPLAIIETASPPLRLTFPTPAAAPVSAWRPPLYPTPWAPTPYDHFYFSRPIGANEINWPLADYRYGGVFLPEVVHTGIDIPAEPGTPVMAAGAGRVTWAGYGLYTGKTDLDDPYGLAIAIKHDFGYQGETLYTVYGHLQQIDVVVGQTVKAGENIGLVGQTGKVTGPHLHFEVRVGKNNFFGSRNPELWLAPPQGWGILAARVMSRGGLLLESHQVTVRALDSRLSWKVNTYGKGAVVSDSYYQENMVLGDLPAGKYVVWIPYQGTTYDLEIEIYPGMVSYFTFHGHNGFQIGLPPAPTNAFTPPADPGSATP